MGILMLMIYWDYILAKIHHRYFIHQNQTYPYFIHSYHWTQYNERSIEIPIFLDLLNQYQKTDIRSGKCVISLCPCRSYYRG
jgi:imidazoleglycerol phosphate synthase glutamine amidotransferase subunit HisH